MAILTSKNTTPATGAVAIYNLKQFLKTAGWTVQASGDGLAAYGAASDVITTGAAGAGGFGQVKAWFRIRMPGSTREFCIQAGNATTNIRVKYSVAGFTGGTPSATNAPTATDEIVIPNLAGGTDAAPTGANFIGTINKVSYWADNASPYGWGMVGWSAVSATTFGFMLEAMAPGTYNAADTDPYVFQSYPNSANFGAFASFSSSAGNTNYGWLAAPGTASSFVAIPFYSYGGTTYNIPVNAQAPVNPFNGKDDTLPTPFIRDAVVAAPGGYKGTGVYTRLLITNRANLTTLSVSTTADRIVFGGISIPWGTDGVTPIP